MMLENFVAGCVGREGFVGEDDVGALEFVAREEVLLVDTDSVAVAFAVKKLSKKVRIEY